MSAGVHWRMPASTCWWIFSILTPNQRSDLEGILVGFCWSQTKIRKVLGSRRRAHLGGIGMKSVRKKQNNAFPVWRDEWEDVVEHRGHTTDDFAQDQLYPDATELASFQWITRDWSVYPFSRPGFNQLNESLNHSYKKHSTGGKIKKKKKRNTAPKEGIILHVFINCERWRLIF